MEERTFRIIPSNHPRDPRYKVFLVVEVEFESVRARTHLLNVSTSGALAHSSAVPRRNTKVVLIYKHTKRRARVVWVEGSRYGLAFEVPLSTAEFEIFLPIS